MAVSTILLGKHLGSTDHGRGRRAGRQYHSFSIKGIGRAQETEIDQEDDRCGSEAEDHWPEQQFPFRTPIEPGQQTE
jgi:hypothetical protein